MVRVRIDTLLSERGLFASRSAAAASVLAGDVLLLPDRRRAEKPGQLVPDDVELEVVAPPPFVSRGGVKLANALPAFGISVEGRRALDVGASTGGFTDCLLQSGAAHVVAVDVAYGELDWRLRSDSRVTVIERSNARALSRSQLPYAPDLIVIDVSFISLAKVLPAVLACAAERFDCLALVKPQFEVGRSAVGKGAVVRDSEARRGAWVRRFLGTPAPVCPDRRATSSRSSGWPRARGTGCPTWRPPRARSSREPGADGHGVDPSPAVGDAAGDRGAGQAGQRGGRGPLRGPRGDAQAPARAPRGTRGRRGGPDRG